MTISPYYTADDFSIDITVTEDGAAKDLTGATVEALFEAADGSSATGTATLADAPNGVIRVTLAENSLTRGVWTMQVRVTIGTETQTVLEDRVSVRQSLSAA